MIDTEQRLQRAADRLAGFHQANVPATSRQGRLDAAGPAGLALGREQQAALAHITRDRGLAIVVGYAWTGKSAMLGVPREAWESAAPHVPGAALSGMPAAGAGNAAGHGDATTASLEPCGA